MERRVPPPPNPRLAQLPPPPPTPKPHRSLGGSLGGQAPGVPVKLSKFFCLKIFTQFQNLVKNIYLLRFSARFGFVTK